MSVSLTMKLARKENFLYVCDYLTLRTSEIRINTCIELILFLKYEDSASYIPSVEDNVQLIVGK